MLRGWHRVANDIRGRRFIDAYSVAAVTLVLAVLSLIGDIVPDQLRWAALLAGVGLLVLHMTVPQSSAGSLDDYLQDRFAFDSVSLPGRLQNAEELWIFAPTAVNILSPHNCDLIRRLVLNKPDGVVRVVVLNPGQSAAMTIATRQLDNSLDYPVQDFAISLSSTLRLLETMAGWKVAGNIQFRLADYSPGFSLVAIDPSKRNGHLIVEFHGFHNEATSSRMHVEIAREASPRWYEYWIDQFNRIWETASLPSGHVSVPLQEPLHSDG